MGPGSDLYPHGRDSIAGLAVCPSSFDRRQWILVHSARQRFAGRQVLHVHFRLGKHARIPERLKDPAPHRRVCRGAEVSESAPPHQPVNLKIQAVKNVGSSWLALAVTVAVGFFLAPFILHKLGDEAYGLWILVFSLTGYYSLFDLGIRSTIVRYVSKLTTTGDDDQLARIINTSFFSYSVLAVSLLVVTAIGSRVIDLLFHVPPAFLNAAPLLFLIVGSSIALNFPLGLFAGILEGLQKFYWLNLTQIISILLRAWLIVVALKRGGGLVTITLITVSFPLLSSVAHILMVRRSLPLPFGARFVDRRSFRQLISYGAATFMIIVAARLRFQTDALVIGMFLSSSAITLFSIGSKLVDYPYFPD
ncbi:MAG: hypothetical protein DMG23_00285 [Acidobacteria bacterium]|nr:MAG: hypothetical protein DMG23_00285 [Acidobacteriota bacterium]